MSDPFPTPAARACVLPARPMTPIVRSLLRWPVPYWRSPPPPPSLPHPIRVGGGASSRMKCLRPLLCPTPACPRAEGEGTGPWTARRPPSSPVDGVARALLVARYQLPNKAPVPLPVPVPARARACACACSFCARRVLLLGQEPAVFSLLNIRVKKPSYGPSGLFALPILLIYSN